MWGGDELELPPSPTPGGDRPKPFARGSTSLAALLPSPAVGSLAASAVPAPEPSPFSPTKKLRAMTLRSNSLNPISEAKPRGPGELLSTFQHRYRQAMTLWDVHAGMGGETGAAFNSVLRREFKSITEAELKEINLGIAAKLRDDKHKEHLDQRKWTDAEKRKLVCLFHAIDVPSPQLELHP